MDIFLKLCESEAITIIKKVKLGLDFTGPLGLFKERHNDIEFHSPGVYGSYNYIDIHIKESITHYQIQKGEFAKENKIEGLFLEPESKHIENLKSWSHRYNTRTHMIPAGLMGVKKAISLIKAYYSGNFKNIPSYLPNKNLKAFSLGAVVLWKAWIKYVDDEDYGRIVDHTKNEDSIDADSHDMTLNLGGICLGGHQGRKYGDKHFVDIQKVFDKYWPDVYLVEEEGECPAPIDGRKAIHRYIEGEIFEELECWDKENEDWD